MKSEGMPRFKTVVCRGLMAFTLVAVGLPAVAQDAVAEKPTPKLPKAEDVIAKFIKATGGKDAWLKHSSRRMKGKFEIPAADLSGPFEAYGAKPNRAVIKLDIPGVGAIRQGFDGKIGWSIHPMLGTSVLEGVQLEQMRVEASFHRELNLAKLYQSVTTIEVTEFDGKKCFKLALMSETSPVFFEFYDVQSGLRRGSQGTAASQMGEMAITNIESGYKKFGGVLVATKTVQKLPMQDVVMTIESIEFDKVDQKVFELPAEIKTLLAQKSEKPKEEKPTESKP